MRIADHWLTGTGVKRLACPKNRSLSAGPELIVLHYTAGHGALSSALHLANPEVKASAHLVIGRDGQVFQLVPFHIQAWHAGKSRYQGREGVNRFSVGIELDNAGRLHRENWAFVSDFGKEYMPDEVYVDYSNGRLTFWHRYTQVQIETLKRVCNLLLRHYPIRDVVGHSDVTQRKQDPGRALGEFRIKDGKFVIEDVKF